MPEISVILPSRNEAAALVSLLPRIRAVLPDAEIIVVDDASTDDTAAVCTASGVRRLHHPLRKGNGAAVKTGARHARGDLLIRHPSSGHSTYT